MLRTNNIDIVLGDFNINAQNQPNQLLQIFSDYKQIVTKPTQLSGAILDHVYLKNDFSEKFDIQTFVKCIYFSDHDAVQLKLELSELI